MLYTDYNGCDCTPDEPWTRVRDPKHHYDKQATFAVSSFSEGRGAKCLIVGSPLFEAEEFVKKGWAVTYMDVRVPPDVVFACITADAATYPFEPESFDAASSTCVLCHAGMGRYTDAILEDADTLMLSNICRALKRGAKAAITFGPVASMSMVARIGNMHRIYNMAEARNMTKGFRILEERILDVERNEWTHRPSGTHLGKTHLSMLLEKI